MENKEILQDEIATRDRVLYYQTLGYLPDPDPVLRKQGKDISAYRDIMADAHLTSVIEQRKDEVLSLEWDIDRGKSKSRHAKAVKKMLERLNVQRIISEILDCTLWGFQPLEILWSTDGSEVYPRDVVGKPQEWFVFGNENELRLRTREALINGITLPEKKFLLARNKPTYLNPYGEKLLSRVFWPVTFKRGGLRFWLTMTEKYGMPHLLGKIERAYFEKEKATVLNMLQNMVQDAVAVVPEGTSIDTIEVNRSASADIYKGLLEFCNSEISKAILTQTLTTELSSGKGSYAASQTHADRLKNVAVSDKRIVEETLNQLIKWYCEMNFSDPGEVPQFYLYEEEMVDKTLAERDKILKDTGVKFTKEYYIKNYGLEEGDFEVTENTPAKPPINAQDKGAQFAEADNPPFHQEALTKLLGSIPDKIMQMQMEQALKPVLDLVNSSSNFSEIMPELMKMYPKLDTHQLESLLERAIFVSEIWGKVNADA